MPCYSPLNGWKDPDSGGIVFKKPFRPTNNMSVACGSCLGCRLDRSRAWAARIVHEAELHEDNSFITLTYRPKEHCTAQQLKHGKYLPEDGSLNKKHFQDFMKRLRKKLSPKNCRYYHCGEYGEKLDRPHYHAILFGVEFDDRELYKDVDGEKLYTSKMLEDTWGYGFATVGSVTFESAAYCARYVMKKVDGVQAKDHYLRCDEYGVAYWLQPEYTTMSRRPGIGKAWYEKYKTDLFPSDEVPIPGRGVFKKVPRYYEDLYSAEDEEAFEIIKEVRKAHYEANQGEYTPERLMTKYKVKKAQVNQLKRNL